MCEPRTKEQLVALLDVGDSRLQGTAALLESVLGAEIRRKRNYVCEVRVFEEGVWRIVAVARALCV